METIQDREKNYLIIENLKDLEEALDTLEEESELVAFDIETDGIDEHIVNTIGIAFTWFEDGGFYLPLYEWNIKTQKLEPFHSDKVRKELVETLCESMMGRKVIMYNGVFDIACIYHEYGINLIECLFADPMLMKHTLEEEHPFGLKEVAQLRFGEDAVSEQKDLEEAVKNAGGKWNKKDKEMYKAPMKILAKYAIQDVILTLKLFDELEEELEAQELDEFFYDIEVMPLYRSATIPMKLNGVHIDVDYFKSLKKDIKNGILSLTEEVFDLISEDIEPKIREILDKEVNTSRIGKFAEEVLRYYEMPVPLNKKTGKPTLAKSALRSLEADYPNHPAIEWLLWEPTKEQIEDEDGKIKNVTIDDPNNPEPELPEEVIYKIKKEVYVTRKPEYPYIFNLASSHHLSWLIYDKYDQTPHKFSKKTKKPTVDKDSLEEFDLPFIPKLAKLKKLEKLLNTYVEPILEKHHNGKIYPSMQQWGTTSGRYSCGGGLNLQTLPKFERPKKCTNETCESKNAHINNINPMTIKVDCHDCGHKEKITDLAMIKRGFVAPKGYKIVAADYSSLEPRCFAYMSRDSNLKRVYKENLDLYSKVAIDTFGLTQYSADENDSNFLKKQDPELRSLSKIFTLATIYGASAGRIANLMKKDFMEARGIIEDYLDAYPNLRNYMSNQEEDAYTTGRVATDFGRIRHLPLAKEMYKKYGKALFNKKGLTAKVIREVSGSLEDAKNEANEIYYKFRNLMNNAKNFPIQATAAHITNAALIYLDELLCENEINGWICLQIHDEVICIVEESQAEEAAELLKEAMENNWVTEEIDVPMIAQPEIGDNFAECK